jgi:hypothetical protein
MLARGRQRGLPVFHLFAWVTCSGDIGPTRQSSPRWGERRRMRHLYGAEGHNSEDCQVVGLGHPL